MRTLTQQLAQYAAYHRDRRNVATHGIGIPLIVIGVNALLARVGIDVAGHSLSLALVVDLAAVVFYLRLDVFFGAAMAVVLGACLAVGTWAAMQSTPTWLAVGVGAFFIGWVFQFIGHHFEGRKPAFVDDLTSLAIGPLFVVAEAAFALGLRPSLARAVHEGGPHGFRENAGAALDAHR